MVLPRDSSFSTSSNGRVLFNDGDELAGVFVFEWEGVLSGLEVYGFGSDAPKALPKPPIYVRSIGLRGKADLFHNFRISVRRRSTSSIVV